MSDLQIPDAIPDDFRFDPAQMPPAATAATARQVSARTPEPAPRQKPPAAPQQPVPQWLLLRRCILAGYILAVLVAVAGPVVGYRWMMTTIEAGRGVIWPLFVVPLVHAAAALAIAFVVQLVSVLLSIERSVRERG